MLKGKALTPPSAQFTYSAVEEGVETVFYVMIEGEIVGYFTLRDQIRPYSAEAIKVLKDKGIKILLLTGDNERVAGSVSKALQMDGFIANVLPHQKQEKVKERRRRESLWP